MQTIKKKQNIETRKYTRFKSLQINMISKGFLFILSDPGSHRHTLEVILVSIKEVSFLPWLQNSSLSHEALSITSIVSHKRVEQSWLWTVIW